MKLPCHLCIQTSSRNAGNCAPWTWPTPFHLKPASTTSLDENRKAWCSQLLGSPDHRRGRSLATTRKLGTASLSTMPSRTTELWMLCSGHSHGLQPRHVRPAWSHRFWGTALCQSTQDLGVRGKPRGPAQRTATLCMPPRQEMAPSLHVCHVERHRAAAPALVGRGP